MKYKNYRVNKKYNTSLKIAAISSAVAMLLPTSILANPIVEDDLEVIAVTASRSDNQLIEQLANQVVITQNDIANIQPKSMVDLLSTVAGIDISSQGGRGQSASMYLRGANASHTLFLINGVRISSASLGLTDIQTIAPELIERIEIIKGPRAALWGSDAIGGVVNIFTRNITDKEGFIGASFGADSYKQYKAGLGFGHGDGASSISFNHEESDGFDVLQNVEEDADGYDYDTLVFRGQQKVDEQFNLEWLAQATEGDNEYDNVWGADQTQIKQHVWYLKGAYDWQVGHVSNTLSATFGQNRDFAKNYGKNITKAQGGYFETRRDQFSVVNNAQVWPHFQMNLGADFYQEKINSTTDFDITQRDIYGIFAHGLYQKQQFTFELALRYDDIEHVDSQTTYNAGVAYQLANDSKLTLNLGSGFKVPTFNDLYWPADPYSSGNPELQPEQSNTVELIYSTIFGAVDFSTSVYYSNIDDLIDWQADQNFFYQPVNVHEVEIKGIEFLADFDALGGHHSISAVYTDSEDKATGQQLAKRAQEQLGYQFNTSVYAVDIFFDYQFYGKRTEANTTLSSFHLVNLTASYDLTGHLSTQLKLTNALDEEYQTALNYNTQDRAVYFGLTYQM